MIRTKDRDKLQKYLSDNGIQSVIHYPIPPHKQQAYQELNNQAFAITEKIHTQCLSIPLSKLIEDEILFFIVDLLNKF